MQTGYHPSDAGSMWSPGGRLESWTVGKDIYPGKPEDSSISCPGMMTTGYTHNVLTLSVVSY